MNDVSCKYINDVLCNQRRLYYFVFACVQPQRTLCAHVFPATKLQTNISGLTCLRRTPPPQAPPARPRCSAGGRPGSCAAAGRRCPGRWSASRSGSCRTPVQCSQMHSSSWYILLRGTLRVVRKFRGSPIFVIYWNFMTRFFEIFSVGVWGVSLPSPLCIHVNVYLSISKSTHNYLLSDFC